MYEGILISRKDMAKKLRYFIDSEGADRQAVKKGLEWLIQTSVQKGYLAVPTLRSLEGVIAEELGQEAAMDLKSRGRTTLAHKELVIITKLRPLRNAGNAPILAFYPYGHFLDMLDSTHNVMAILVVPWRRHEIDYWIRVSGAKELGAKKSPPAHEPLKNRVVQEALADLSTRINPATGIEHPEDREAAVQALCILKEGGEQLSPLDIKSWMVSNAGWKATHAQELAELVQHVLDGTIVCHGQPAWRPDSLSVWRARASKK